MKWLALNSNKLLSVPPSVGTLPHLERLSLHINELTALPAELGGMSAMEALSIHRNKLTAVPAELGRLKRCARLSLYENELTEVRGWMPVQKLVGAPAPHSFEPRAALALTAPARSLRCRSQPRLGTWRPCRSCECTGGGRERLSSCVSVWHHGRGYYIILYTHAHNTACLPTRAGGSTPTTSRTCQKALASSST